uniref:Putative cell wall protein awa1 n=1 Tax=Phlebotomus kandelakii TaxID=1109342 RepID=A0A6B2E913_9DIPT
MICKDSVVSWFKELESYKRIDTMCTLLNMCLPFELRFLGTCLEELGRRDSQELRGIELRVNNPTELAADIASCQSGEPTDMKIRRKMALYLALIRVCSRPCVNELFRTLDGWGERDLGKFSDGDPLQELLLVYTMATNHPVFSFEQRMKCAEIFTKIKECRPASQSTATAQHNISPQQTLLTNSTHSPPGIHTIHHHQLMGQPQIPMGFTQMIPGAEAQLGAPIVDPMMQLPPGMTIPTHDFTVGPPTTVPWTIRHGSNIPAPAAQSTSLDSISLHATQPTQPTSPLLSQPSSPSQSRGTSPTRSSQGGGHGTNLQQTQSHLRGSQQHGQQRRMSRRPSIETTPPPPMQAPPPNYVNILGGDIIVQQQNHKNFEEMMLTVDGALSQLQTICRNGYTRPAHTIPRQPSKGSGGNYPHQQSQSTHQNHHQSSNFPSNPTGLAYALNNMAFDNVHHQVKSGGSDSGSSVGSAGDLSPPDTPSAISTVASTSRLRPDKVHIYTPPAAIASPSQSASYANVADIVVAPGGFGNGSGTGSGSTGGGSTVGNMVLMTQTQFQTTYPTFRQPPPLMAPQQITSPTTATTTTTFRHPYQLQPNGEFLYPAYTPATAQIALLNTPVSNVVSQPAGIRSSPLLQPPQQQHYVQTYPSVKMVLSCFNCGSQLHTGRDCQESSMEDATRGAVYKLDYNAATTSASQTHVMDSVSNATAANVSNQDISSAPSVTAINK